MPPAKPKPEPSSTGIYINNQVPDASNLAAALECLLQTAFETHMDQAVVLAALRVLERGVQTSPTHMNNVSVRMDGGGGGGGNGGTGDPAYGGSAGVRLQS